ncbi:hypothetical protein [Metabacillus niabensis]|uniref:hypothetical protein n=1 Tax=Metabacillus niabensis TaxID=324854 RepID=UPI001CFA0795|nr:hypothetical protein [Metabacillus niabensis]
MTKHNIKTKSGLQSAKPITDLEISKDLTTVNKKAEKNLSSKSVNYHTKKRFSST